MTQVPYSWQYAQKGPPRGHAQRGPPKEHAAAAALYECHPPSVMAGQGAPGERHCSMKVSRMFPTPPNLSRVRLGRVGGWLENSGQCYRYQPEVPKFMIFPASLKAFFSGRTGMIKWNSLLARAASIWRDKCWLQSQEDASSPQQGCSTLYHC